MDVLSFGKASAAKRAIKQLNDRLGSGVKGTAADVKTRLDNLDKLNPNVTLYNRVSDVEANISINLNKHNLHVNTVVNKNKFNLTDLAFDDFTDTSGIDATLSKGYTYDSTNHIFTITSGQTEADIITTSEVLSSTPHMIAVSQAYNDTVVTTPPSISVSRDDGTTWKTVQPDVLTTLDDLPTGSKLRVKIVLINGLELHALSYSWI